MVFSSIFFILFFLPVSIAVYYIASHRHKNFVLLISGFFFYLVGDKNFFPVLVLLTIFNYFLGRKISKENKSLLYLGVGINLFVLVFYKYSYFILSNIDSTWILSEKAKDIALPLGISFFIFQSISYLIDVYRDDGSKNSTLSQVMLYITLFPQLIAGPIVRYKDIDRQLDSRSYKADLLLSGLERFILGLTKKVLIANVCGQVADSAFGLSANNLTTLDAWFGLSAYTLQIYFDFSGYSDMAIGVGRMFGFELKENFANPYKSRSVQEFWRRWHISLSQWFRDYLYIPLGGNRKGNLRTSVNLFVVFLLCGFWHGASWTFIAWGLYHGIFLTIERIASSYKMIKIPSAIKFVYTIFVVMIGWALFRAESINHFIDYLLVLLGKAAAETSSVEMDSFYVKPYILSIVLGFFLSLGNGFYKDIFYDLKGKMFIGSVKVFLQRSYMLFLLFLFLVSVLRISGEAANPFIYFRF